MEKKDSILRRRGLLDVITMGLIVGGFTVIFFAKSAVILSEAEKSSDVSSVDSTVSSGMTCRVDALGILISNSRSREVFLVCGKRGEEVGVRGIAGESLGLKIGDTVSTTIYRPHAMTGKVEIIVFVEAKK